MKNQTKNILALFVAFLLIFGAYTASNYESDPVDNGESSEEEVEDNLTEFISWEDGASMGDPDAPVRMVNFSSYYCPFCVTFKEDVFPLLEDKYIDEGDLFYLYRDLGEPGDSTFQASYCADEEGSFWDYQKALYKEDPTPGFSTQELISLAGDLGLNQEEFEYCLEQNRYDNMITMANLEADSLGITGTPYILIENTEVVGLRDFEDYKSIIEEKLNENN